MDRNRFKTVAFKIGDGNKSNFIELALEIENKCGSIEYLCTDKNTSYGYYKIANKHISSKSETCLVESFNSSMRDMLAQLNRRTKRFSKSIEMLSCLADVVTNNLIFFKDNNASQNTARLDSFNLMPSTKLMEDLNQDYENMAMMIFRRCSRF